MTTHTIRICSNPKIFVIEYSLISNKIINLTLDIYEDVRKAASTRVHTLQEWQIRQKYQLAALSKCDALLSMIDIAKPLYHLEGKKTRYWIKLTVNTKTLLQYWTKKEKEFCYKKFRV